MKSTISTVITAAALLSLLVAPAQVVGQQEQDQKRVQFPHYRVIDLGTLKGDSSSQGLGIGPKGQVGGVSINSNGIQRAFLWTKHSGMQDLGTLGGPNSAAGPVNQNDEVAVVSEIAKTSPYSESFCGFGTTRECLGAVWKDGELTPLPTLGGPSAGAYDLNEDGQVVGFSETERKEEKGYCLTPSQRYDFKGVIWQPNGEPQELDPLPGDTVSFAFGINDKGQTVGGSGLCSNTTVPPAPNAPHAVLWEADGTPTDLGNLRGATTSVASSINNRGEVVGGGQLKNGTFHSFLWTKETGMHDLGTLPGDVVTIAPCCNSINDSREIVGFSCPGPKGNCRAFVWKDNVIMDLNTLLPKDSPWYLQAAEVLNDAGEITGYGTIHGETHAFLAIPCHRHGDGRECCEDDD